MTLVQTEPKSIKIGTTPVKSVYVGTTKVRPAGWTPGVNTVAYYSFDDQGTSGYVKDFSGNGYNLNTGVQPSYSLLSGNNYVGVYSGTGVCYRNWTYTGNIKTISMWLNVNTQTSQYIMEIGLSGDQFSIIYGFSGSKLEFYSSSPRTTLVNSLSINTWYHLCLTNRSSNTWTVYVNNTQVTTFSKTLPTNRTFIAVGASDVASDRMKGKLDNVIIESTARTAQEISDYYNLTKGTYGL